MPQNPGVEWLYLLFTVLMMLAVFADYCGHCYSEMIEHPNVITRNLLR